MRAERLPDDHRRGEAEHVDPGGQIVHERLPREILRAPLAAPMPALLDRRHPVGADEPRGRVVPLAGISRQAVDEEGR